MAFSLKPPKDGDVAQVVTCQACRNGQLKLRGEPLCAGCARAALEVAPDPTWVLDSPLLRQVLAEVNVPAVVAVIRSACGLSQEDMAGVAGWSRSALSCYERGLRESVFDVRALLQFADAVGMPRTALIALILTDSGATASRVDEGAVPRPRSAAQQPDVFRLRYWQACTVALLERDRNAGGTALLRSALLLWRQASPTEGRDNATGVDWLATAAGIALYAGQAALDAGCLVRARSLHKAARDLAGGVRDPLLTAHVLVADSRLRAAIARTGGSREQARQALLLAREATEEARYEPVPQLHALISVRVAQAAALLGERPAFDAAITRARRELDRHRRDIGMPVPAWLRHVGHADITIAEAAGQADLGEMAGSLALYRQALAQASCPRDRALAAAGLAHALAVSGDRAEAVATALGQALPLLESGVTSARCLDQLRQVAAAAGAIPGAAELRERIEARKRAIPDAPAGEQGTPPALTVVSA
jgi:transcriptional regulator with XRE-family HTH domain